MNFQDCLLAQLEEKTEALDKAQADIILAIENMVKEKGKIEFGSTGEFEGRCLKPSNENFKIVAVAKDSNNPCVYAIKENDEGVLIDILSMDTLYDLACVIINLLGE